MFPWNKFIKLGKEWKKKKSRELVYASHKLPLIMVSNVQENASFIHKFWKISLPWERGGELPSHTLPSLGRFASSLCPRWQILAAPLLLE